MVKKIILGMLIAVLTFGMTVTGCEDSSTGGGEGGYLITVENPTGAENGRIQIKDGANLVSEKRCTDTEKVTLVITPLNTSSRLDSLSATRDDGTEVPTSFESPITEETEVIFYMPPSDVRINGEFSDGIIIGLDSSQLELPENINYASILDSENGKLLIEGVTLSLLSGEEKTVRVKDEFRNQNVNNFLWHCEGSYTNGPVTVLKAGENGLDLGDHIVTVIYINGDFYGEEQFTVSVR